LIARLDHVWRSRLDELISSAGLLNTGYGGVTAIRPHHADPPGASCPPGLGKRSHVRVMALDLTDHEAAVLLKELNGLIDGHRYSLSERIRTLKAIRAKIGPEPAREPPPPPLKHYAPPRASAAKRRGSRR
jgi:hypothetical protein